MRPCELRRDAALSTGWNESFCIWHQRCRAVLRLDLCMHPLTQSYKILRGDKTKRGFVFRGQPCPQAPPQDGGASALPIFLRFTSVHAYTFCCRRTTIFGVVTCGGGTRVSGVSYTPPISRDLSSGLRNFGDSPVF